jgi:hypothetical protein
VSPPLGISRQGEGVQGSRRWRPFVLQMLSAKVAAKYSRGVSSESTSLLSLVELAESEVREADFTKGLCAGRPVKKAPHISRFQRCGPGGWTIERRDEGHPQAGTTIRNPRIWIGGCSGPARSTRACETCESVAGIRIFLTRFGHSGRTEDNDARARRTGSWDTKTRGEWNFF